MDVSFLDLRVKDPELKRELLEAVDRVLSHGQLMLGPEVEALEKLIAEMSRKRFAVGMASGTDALYLALRALDVGPGDEVITTPLAWVATANAITLCGATPVFVDVRDDMNIDESLIPAGLTSRTKVILPVHWHGRLCRMTEICRTAADRGIAVVEDAAQAVLAERDGRCAGSFGRVNCFSMNPMKLWGAYGEAGAVVTDDETIRDRLISLRYAGTINKEDCHDPSLNARIDTIQAALLLVNAKRLRRRIECRRANAQFYTETLRDVVRCPDVGVDHIFYTYTIQTDRRDELSAYLQSRGIEVRIRQPFLITQQAAYRHLPAPAPVAERLIRQILSLPVHQDITREELEYVVSSVRNFFSGK